VSDTLPPRYSALLKVSSAQYTKWKKLYCCKYKSDLPHDALLENRKPTEHHPASIWLSPYTSFRYPDLTYMSDFHSSEQPVIISNDLLKEFLAHVHAFTVVGLEAQGMAYSRGANGVIKYLSLLPQINGTDAVRDVESELTSLDACQKFQELDGLGDGEDYVMRCWIHTHPRHKAFMSHLDIIQLHSLQSLDRNAFGIVLSPRMDASLKALCVRLTEDGFNAIKDCQNSEHILEGLVQNSGTKFYYQVPFVVSMTTAELST